MTHLVIWMKGRPKKPVSGKIFFLEIVDYQELRFVFGPVIQANGRLIFEDDLGSGGLLCFTIKYTVNQCPH